MANVQAALGSALYSVLSGGTVNIYQGVAPQGGTPPFCVFQLQSAVDGYTFDSEDVSADYMVRVISDRNWPSEAISIYDHLHGLLQDGNLSVSDYAVLRCRRRSSVQFRDPEGFWHVGGIYRIDVHR